MADETWREIFKTRRVWDPPTTVVNRPMIVNPECPKDCARHDTEAYLLCPRCQTRAYAVVAHLYPWESGHFWYTVEPVNGSPTDPRATHCRDCGTEFVRR